MTSIVIVSHNSAADLPACLRSVRAHSDDAEIIVIDTASRDGSADAASTWADRVVRLAHNGGYAPAAMLGARLAAGPALLFLNPDTVVGPGWLEHLRAHLRPGVAAVGPVSNWVWGFQKVQVWAPPAWDLAGMSAEQVATGLYTARAGMGVPVLSLTGFCLLVEGAAFGALGFDEEFTHGADDLDFSLRAREAGYQLTLATDTFIFHHGGRSFGSEPPAEIAAHQAAMLHRLAAKTLARRGRLEDPRALFGFRPFDWPDSYSRP